MSVQIERRAGGPRVPLQTLVEIGAATGGSAAFEAEAVDVTTAGMRIRTAYLPEIGQPLICRFEGGGTEVVAHGQVAWAKEETRGGDFGVQFLEMDQESLDALRAIVHEDQREEEEQHEKEQQVSATPVVRPGTRARLHIEGLGAPMKARVRNGNAREVVVGSNLEFLRLGRSLDIENVDSNSNRPARIERVSVEIEPTSRVPQLTVALRYLDVPEDEPAAVETKFADDDFDDVSDDTIGSASGGVSSGASYDSTEGQRNVGDDGSAGDEAGTGEEEGMEASPGVSTVVRASVRSLGPKLSEIGSLAQRWGSKAKDAVSDAVVGARSKASQKVEERKAASKPRRTTSPPPKGGYSNTGYRKQHAVRPEDEPAGQERGNIETALRKHLNKRSAMIGIAATLALILGVGLARAAFRSSPERGALADDMGLTADEQQDFPIVPGAMGADSSGGGLVANVPLFGPTPMTTSAPMAPMAAIARPVIGNPVPIADDEDFGSEEDDESGGVVAAAVEGDSSDFDDEDVADEQPSAKPATGQATKPAAKKTAKAGSNEPSLSFGRGKISSPVVFTLRMNQKVKELRGAPQPHGFAVDVVGARSTEPAAGFRRQDSRIAESKVVNRGSNSQLTIRFSGPTPGYRVQANGSTLRITIDGDKKTASIKGDKGRKPR